MHWEQPEPGNSQLGLKVQVTNWPIAPNFIVHLPFHSNLPLPSCKIPISPISPHCAWRTHSENLSCNFLTKMDKWQGLKQMSSPSSTNSTLKMSAWSKGLPSITSECSFADESSNYQQVQYQTTFKILLFTRIYRVILFKNKVFIANIFICTQFFLFFISSFCNSFY